MRGSSASQAALSFRVGSIPVRVDPWIPLFGLLVGLAVRRGAVWAAVAAASFVLTVFVHELAHAVAIRALGGATELELTVIRDTLGRRIRSMPPRARALASLAGPAASLCLGAAALGGSGAMHSGGAAHEAVRYFGVVNLAWGLLNLLPIVPLDGGHALMAAMDGVTKGRGEQPARWVSVVGAIALGLLAVRGRALLPVVVCGLWALQNARALRTRDDRNLEAILRVHLQAAFEAAERDDSELVIHHCHTVLHSSRDRATRRDAVRLLAYAYVLSDRWERLAGLLEADGAVALAEEELEKLEHLAADLGRAEEARRMGALRRLRA